MDVKITLFWGVTACSWADRIKPRFRATLSSAPMEVCKQKMPVTQQPPSIYRHKLRRKKVAIYRGLTVDTWSSLLSKCSWFFVLKLEATSSATLVRIDKTTRRHTPGRPSFDVKSRAKLNSLSPETFITIVYFCTATFLVFTRRKLFLHRPWFDVITIFVDRDQVNYALTRRDVPQHFNLHPLIFQGPQLEIHRCFAVCRNSVGNLNQGCGVSQ